MVEKGKPEEPKPPRKRPASPEPVPKVHGRDGSFNLSESGKKATKKSGGKKAAKKSGGGKSQTKKKK